MTFSDFFSHLPDLDWVGILAGTVALMVFGFLWYGPILGKAWSKATGQPMNSSAKGMGPQLAFTAVYLLVFNVGLAYMVGSVDDIEYSLVAGLIVGLLIIGAAMYSSVVWTKSSTTRWMIDAGHWFFATAIAVYVQGLMA